MCFKWKAGTCSEVLVSTLTCNNAQGIIHFKTWCTCYAGRSAAVLLYMQQHARKPLRLLRHDNYATFAEIFTTALLQAAATGESLLATHQSESEQVLQKQADKDASKMFRLNQRMQVGCPNPCRPPPPTPPVRTPSFPIACMVLFCVCCKYSMSNLHRICTVQSAPSVLYTCMHSHTLNCQTLDCCIRYCVAVLSYATVVLPADCPAGYVKQSL